MTRAYDPAPCSFAGGESLLITNQTALTERWHFTWQCLAEWGTDLMSELVEEDDGAVALGGVACNLPERLAHKPRLSAHCRSTRGR